ncbi:DUF2442 domain-containing protein [Achromobacter aloeverae]|uniref:DUF2442 domain-containing protein n=1 Tax=Achromobacter aloeverae TaxID=1750518 RepID=A0A4Q1HNM9_9BURK|nr:DUF2442 domain-containing protein [Achromobacter aloeverae]RXN91435.1 hypothetical protein C7R54_09825 [Achromobacter aloeverae]
MKAIKARERYDEPVTTDVVARAIERGGARRTSSLHASAVQYLADLHALLVGFADHTAIVFPVANTPELAELSRDELERMTIGFGGSALCLDARDLHISIAGLVSASPPLMALAATVVAARNGRRSSEAKRQAARANGLKGGRPRKMAVAG